MNLTQKISQMTPKGADLDATDLIEVSTIVGGSYVTKSITGQELIDAIPAPTGFVPDTRTLTINGVAQDLSADRSWTISTGLTVGTTPISSGTIGRVLFQGTGNVLQQSSQFSWDNSTNALTLTTGKVFSAYQSGSTVNDALKLNVSNDGAVFGIQNSSATGFSGIEYLNNLGVSKVFTGFNNNDGQEFRFNNFATNGFIDFRIGGTSGLRLFTTRNVGIGTTTDAGFRLDVNGTARVSGLVTATLSNYNSTHSGNTTRGFYIVNSSDSVVRGGIEYDGTNAFVQLAGRYNNGAAFFRQDGSNGNISFLRSGSEYGRIFGATGNWGINTTTDAGFRLDVNGTARVQGNLTLTSAFQVKFANNNRWIGPSELYAGVQIYAAASGSDVIQMTAGQQVHISSAGGTTTQTSSVLQVDSTTKGFLPPRMTTTQKNAIASPATGLQVYDTTLNQMSYYNGTTWTNI